MQEEEWPSPIPLPCILTPTALCLITADMQMDRRAFTLQPLVAQGILHPGDNRLSCAVGGIDYYAGAMSRPHAMHRDLQGIKYILDRALCVEHRTASATCYRQPTLRR